MVTETQVNQGELILKQFSDWADDLLSFYYEVPRQSPNHRNSLEERIKMLEVAKTHLAQIVRGVSSG